MQYYIKVKDGVILEFAKKEDIDSGEIAIDWNEVIDYAPIQYNEKVYTQEKFAEIQNSQEYKEEQEQLNKGAFEFEAKQMEEQYTYIEYKGKKISLEEILFKSAIYTSISDLYVYLKTFDKDLIKVNRATFLLIVAKAKSNLKDTEEALYNASYDKTKSLEDNIKAIKNIFNAIDKIFNG